MSTKVYAHGSSLKMRFLIKEGREEVKIKRLCGLYPLAMPWVHISLPYKSWFLKINLFLLYVDKCMSLHHMHAMSVKV